MDDFWSELKESGRDYVRKGKDVIRDTIVIEFSPTVAESSGWKRSDWMQAAEDLVENIDAVEIYKQVRDRKTKDWIRDDDGNPKKFPVPKTELKNSKWMAYLHRDSESGIPHLHIVISRYTEDCKLNCDTDIAKKGAIACEKLNVDRGWTKAEDIKNEHIMEINKVINAIMDEMGGNDIDFSDLRTKVEAQTYTDYKGRVRHYELQYHEDSNGKVDGYSVKRGNSIYTAGQLGQKVTNITADRKDEIKDAIYDALRKMDTPKFDWMKFKAMMEASDRYQMELIRDSKDDVVRYNVKCNGRTYNASQIGANVTALKIQREYERIQREQKRIRQQTAASNKPTAKPVQLKQAVTHKPVEPKPTQQKSAQIPVVKREPTKGELERNNAIDSARRAIWSAFHSYMPKRALSLHDIEDVMPAAIAAKAINDGKLAGDWCSASALENAAQSLVGMVDLSAAQTATAMEGMLSAIVNMVLPPVTPSSDVVEAVTTTYGRRRMMIGSGGRRMLFMEDVVDGNVNNIYSMAENKNIYGGHDVSGYIPPTLGASQSTTPDQAPVLTMEYLEKISSILDRMEKMEAFIALDDERRKAYEKQRTADISALRAVVTNIVEVKNKIWEAGSNTDDMLKDISELKEQGVDLTASAKETLQNVGNSIRKQMEEYLEGDFVGQVDAHMNGLKNKVEAIEVTHRLALNNLKHEYEESIRTLESKKGKLFAQIIEEKNCIILPFESFWAISCIFGIAIFCGFVCWYKFWKTPGNDETMTYMAFACILEVIYYGMMAWNYFTDNEKQKKGKTNGFSVSLSEAIYIILLTFTSIVYLVWSLLDITSSTKMLIYLLPIVFASNFIWLLLRALAYGVFQKD